MEIGAIELHLLDASFIEVNVMNFDHSNLFAEMIPDHDCGFTHTKGGGHFPFKYYLIILHSFKLSQIISHLYSR